MSRQDSTTTFLNETGGFASDSRVCTRKLSNFDRKKSKHLNVYSLAQSVRGKNHDITQLVMKCQQKIAQ